MSEATMDLAAVVRAALAQSTLPVRDAHGVAHWARVLETGLQLAVTTGADMEVVALFAVCHDARRWDEGWDPGQGAGRGIRPRAAGHAHPLG